MMPDLFDAALSRQARDLGLKKVSDHSKAFMIVALHAIGTLPSGDWTGENIRDVLTTRGIVPGHPNAWGSLIRTALNQHLLTPTGRFTQMTAVKSHARKTEIYTR